MEEPFNVGPLMFSQRKLNFQYKRTDHVFPFFYDHGTDLFMVKDGHGLMPPPNTPLLYNIDFTNSQP